MSNLPEMSRGLVNNSENDLTDRLYNSVYKGNEEMSLQSLEAGNDPLSIYKQVSTLNDSFESRDCQSLNSNYQNFDMDKKSLNSTLEDLSLFDPFPNTQGKLSEGKSSLTSQRMLMINNNSNYSNSNPNINKSSSNLKSSTSVSGLFSSFANTVTQNISSQIQNALRETTSNIIVSSSNTQKTQDLCKWSKIISKIHQNKGPASIPNLEICENDVDNVTKNMNIILFPGEKLLLFSKECGFSAQNLVEPIFGSLIMTNFRIILAPLFQKNTNNKALTIIKRFSVSWMYKSGFLHIPINSITKLELNSVVGGNEQNGVCIEGNSNQMNPGQFIGSNLNLGGSLGGVSGGSGISQMNVNCRICTYTLDISTKDLRYIQVLMVSSEQDKKLIQNSIQNILNNNIPKNLFSYTFKENFESLPLFSSLSGAFEFDIFKEFIRQGVPMSSSELTNGNPSRFRLRFSNVNQNFELCSSYPKVIVVPESISDSQLIKVAAFRSKGRIPILSWTNPDLKCTLWRSSQPKSAFKRCIEDEIMITTISSFYKNNADPQEERPFAILDARPKLNAFANKATGAGFENIDHYNNCKLEFLNIENIHKVRDSWNKLVSVIQKVSNYDSNVGNTNLEKAIDLLNQEGISSSQAQSILTTLNRMNNSENMLGLKLTSEIDSTGWYDLISMILASSNKIVDNLIRGKGVLVHCSDGWDRTSQLTALAMLCIDPYYRTIQGFLSLIEKEFILSGHKFHSRCGTPGKEGSCLENESERSPIFIQWLDCVYQCFTQFPTEFQFHPNLLIVIADHLSNSLFGNFHCDNEHERSSMQTRELTTSLWDTIIYSIKNKSKEGPENTQVESLLSLNSCIIFHKELINPLYNPTHTQVKTYADVLILDSSSFGINPWMPFWFRFTPVNARTVSNPLLYSYC